MGEKRDIDKKAVSYKGLFKAEELYKSIEEWRKENKYEIAVEKHSEVVSEKGKEVEFPMGFDKKASDYIKFTIKAKVTLKNVEDVLVKKGGAQQKLHKGDVDVAMKAVIETDYDNKWSKVPWRIFIRGLHDKFLRKSEIDEFEKKLKEDLSSLYEEVKAQLNLFKYKG